MADETKPAIGMSVGATTLAAVTADHAVTRRPVLTLYRNRSAQIGLPSENPSTDEPGLVITDFVHQVGDSGPVVASDGSAHRAEQLLADGLHALAYVATDGRPLPPAVAVTHPAHWTAVAVEALVTALSRVPEWSRHPVSLISDVAAVLTALKANPGLPTEGIIAVCDFGGTGANITLVDADREYQPVDRTVRHTGFCGDLIDQALLDHVVADLSAGDSLDGAVAIGSLAGLRTECRNAKERLSTETVTELPVDLPGFHGGVWVTRAELDEVIRQPFDGFLAAVQKALGNNAIEASDLAAVVSVGGVANVPAVTSGLSQRLGVTVVSSPRPQLTAAIGAALTVARGSVSPVRTAPAPTTPAPTSAETTPTEAETPSAPMAPAAPPQPPQPPPMTPMPSEMAPLPPEMAPPSMQPPPGFDYQRASGQPPRGDVSWYRRPLPVILAVAVAVLAVGIVAVIALRHAANTEPVTPTAPSEPAESTDQPPRHLPPGPGERPVFPEVPTLPQLPEIPTILTTPPVPEAPEGPAVP